MIPKILHFVWLGSELPDEEKRNIDSWKKHNPDLKIMLWGNDNISQLNLNEDAMKAFQAGEGIYAYQSDIIRLHAANKFGGFYSDTDIECHKPIPQEFFTKNYVVIKPRESANWLTNAFFGAQSNSSLMEQMVNGIIATTKEDVDARRCYIYGPVYFTKVIRENIGVRQEESVLNIPKFLANSLVLDHWFWSLNNDERYCTHYFKASWIKRKT